MSLDENVAKNFICSLCNHPFEDPRNLPCQHSFCLRCLQGLVDKAKQKNLPSSSPSKKVKISCDKCGTAFVVPAKGVESFAKDNRISKMREDTINKLAEDISRKIRSSENLKTDISDNLGRSTNRLGNNSFSGFDAKKDEKYNRFGNLDKYSKYFEDSNNGTEYKPTIRPDHTRLGYENSVRFRHRRSCGDRSTDRHSYIDDDSKRTSWSEQRARRAYSLNRSTMDALNNSRFTVSRDNMTGIIEVDSPMSPTHNLSNPIGQVYSDSSNVNIKNEEAIKLDLKYEEIRTKFGSKVSDKVNSNRNGFESIKEGLLAGREGFLGKKRADIAKGRKPMTTHRDILNKNNEIFEESQLNFGSNNKTKDPNIFEYKFEFKKNYPSSPKGSMKSTEKTRPKTLRKKSKSPINRPASPSYKSKTSVRRLSQSPKRPGSRKSDRSSNTSITPQNEGNETPEGDIFHDKYNKPVFSQYNDLNKNKFDEATFAHTNYHIDANVRSKFDNKYESPNYTKTSDIPRNTNFNAFANKNLPKHEEDDVFSSSTNKNPLNLSPTIKIDHADYLNEFSTSTPRPSVKPRRRDGCKINSPKIRSSTSEFSFKRFNRGKLNASSFENKSDYRDYLLNMTMNKSKFEHMMSGVRDTLSSDSFDLDEDKENEIIFDEPQRPQAPPPPPRRQQTPLEPMIDINIINSVREKFMSPTHAKRVKRQLPIEFANGVTQLWSFEKNEYGSAPTSMIFIPSTMSAVVAEYGLSLLEYLDINGFPEHKMEGIKPFGLAIDKLERIFVGDRRGKMIRIFDKFGCDIAQIDVQFNWISGLAFTKAGELVVCDRERCKIGIYTVAGDKIREFGSYGKSNRQFCMVDFFCVDSKDRILLADSGNHCIKIFDTTGTPISQCSIRGDKDGELQWPKGICVDNMDNIIVADSTNRRITSFSSDGKFLKHLVTEMPLEPFNVTYGADMLGVIQRSLDGISSYQAYSI